MGQGIPDSHKDMLGKVTFAHLATLNPDGSPQNTPIWFEFDGENILINSSKGRWKDRNMRRDARVALSIIDPDNAYRYLEVRGRVVDITEEEALDHINKLAKMYLGKDEYPFLQPGEVPRQIQDCAGALHLDVDGPHQRSSQANGRSIRRSHSFHSRDPEPARDSSREVGREPPATGAPGYPLVRGDWLESRNPEDDNPASVSHTR